MCGIIGYTGERQAAPILLEGLKNLEYRGYDSAGIAVYNNKRIELIKAKGRLKMLFEKTNDGKAVSGHIGIGHTRWATHGEPSELNAHPHMSSDGKVILVHNGIIENYVELRGHLSKEGYTVASQTDTEVAANLISYFYKAHGEPLSAISDAMLRIRGSYAFAILFSDLPDCFYVARKDSPLVVGVAEDGYFAASDVPAILSHTRDVYYMENYEIGRVEKDGVAFFNSAIEPINKELTHIDWDSTAAQKGGYAHFMLKEIEEQPTAVRDTLLHYVKDGRIDLSETGLDSEFLKRMERICFVACGSAYHACCVAKYVIEKIARIQTDVDLASEFRYRDPILSDHTLCIIISQSGETADSLAAMRLAKERGVRTLGIVNVVGSSIAREADGVMYTLAGPEIAVATTKAFSAQLAAVYLLSVAFAYERGVIDEEKYCAYVSELSALPEKIDGLLKDKERIQWFADKFSGATEAFFIGRGIDYATAMEGSLKLKEVSYIHSEAYAAGELKHGTISLIEQGRPVFGIVTDKGLYGKMMSNIEEVRSRGAYVFVLTVRGNYGLESVADFTLYIPETDPAFTPSLAVIPLQLLAYYSGLARGHDVDKPRNLAKSVTVE